jgi:hypothetical protein
MVRLGKNSSLSSFSYKTTNAIIEASPSWPSPSYLPKALPANAINMNLGIKLATYEFLRNTPNHSNHYFYLKLFHHSQPKLCTHETIISLALVTSILLFVSMNLSILVPHVSITTQYLSRHGCTLTILCAYITFCLSIYSLIDLWVIPTFWLLWCAYEP